MCMIVDTSRMSDFLTEPKTPDAEPIHRWLQRGWGTLAFSMGAKFASELEERYPKAKTLLLRYWRDGQARGFPDEEVEGEAHRLESEGFLRSNDSHVLALARVSGARLLYCGDRALMADFKDERVLRKPRGRVYSGAKNKRLLTRDACRIE